MLRVTTILHEDHYRFELHGMLGGEWVPLLERHWHAVVDGIPSARVTVVLTDVDFIDADGEQLLERMAESGVEFVASGCMNRYVVEKIQSSTYGVKGARR